MNKHTMMNELLRFTSLTQKTIGLVVLLSLTACASKVTVVANIPTPLVEKVPLNVHLVYSEAFRNYSYNESERRRVLSSINFSQAQEQMFNSVFTQLTNLVPHDDIAKDIDIEPQILDFQYTAPHETKLQQYEVWLKYRLRIADTSNKEIADWTLKGYGKTPTALLTSASKAFNSATNIALRDIGAQLATRFSGQKVIKQLLDAKGQLTASSNTYGSEAIAENDANSEQEEAEDE